MAKFFKTSEDIKNIFEEEFSKVGLEQVVSLNVIGCLKSKDLIKVKKESPTGEFLLNESPLVNVIVYEEAFDRLDDDTKKIIAEMMISAISYDGEKDKLNIEGDTVRLILNMRRKYGDDILNNIELPYHVLDEIAQEEKERKLEKKNNK
jgi:hypothetical protein